MQLPFKIFKDKKKKKRIESFTGPYRFLSNFFMCPVVIGKHVFKSSEHAFQYFKTFDKEYRCRIKNTAKPGQAKFFGGEAPRRPDWEDVKEQVMYEILKEKFKIHALRQRLLATEDAVLVEGNTWHDNIWGDCRCFDRQTCRNPGQNLLGKILMRIREEIRVDK